MAKKGPLKKVMREFTVEERNFHGTIMKGLFFMEELECGHIIPKPSDLHGHYDSVKRRCTQCAAEHSAHLTACGRAQFLVLQNCSLVWVVVLHISAAGNASHSMKSVILTEKEK